MSAALVVAASASDNYRIADARESPARGGRGRDRLCRSPLSREDDVMRLVPAAVVDRLPVSWRRPGNHPLVANRSIQLCVNGQAVRTIEVDRKEIARGRKRFPDGAHWSEGPPDR